MRSQLFEHLAAYVLSMHADGVKTATRFMLPDMTVRITADRNAQNPRTGQMRKKKRVRVTVSVGRPNYAERAFIKDCQKAGERFPVRKIQIKHYPKRRGGA